MSVKSAMTAIADKIRALLGVNGSMGLETMATNLDTVQRNIASAYDAVRNQGGTVPAVQASGNLATAISSIPAGAAMREASGTAKADEYGEITINCGFRPDYLFLFGDAYYLEEDECWYEPVVGIPLIDMNASTASMPESLMYWGEELLAAYPWEVTSTSVTAALWFIGWDWDYTQAGNVEVRYKAVQFQ